MKPVVDRLQQQYAGKIDFVMYPTVDKDRAASAFANQHSVQAVPTMVLVSPDGTERKRWVGTQPEEELSAQFELAAAGAR